MPRWPIAGLELKINSGHASASMPRNCVSKQGCAVGRSCPACPEQTAEQAIGGFFVGFSAQICPCPKDLLDVVALLKANSAIKENPKLGPARGKMKMVCCSEHAYHNNQRKNSLEKLVFVLFVTPDRSIHNCLPASRHPHPSTLFIHFRCCTCKARYESVERYRFIIDAFT